MSSRPKISQGKDDSISYNKFKNSNSLDITKFSLLKVKGRFGVTCRFHLQGRRINQARNKLVAGCQLRLDFSILNGILSHKKELLLTTSVGALESTSTLQWIFVHRYLLRCIVPGFKWTCRRSADQTTFTPLWYFLNFSGEGNSLACASRTTVVKNHCPSDFLATVMYVCCP